MKQALVVGGQHGFVKEKLAKSLARHGIRIQTHWSWDKKRPPQTFPQGLDLVYICTDMVGHGLSVPCMEWARDHGIPYINGTRKWAESIVRLTQGGFPLLDPLTAVPEIVEEIRRTRSAKEMEQGPSEEEMQALAVAFTGDLDKAKDLVGVYTSTGHVEFPAEVLPTSTFPPSTSTAAALQESAHMSAITNTSHLAITNSKQREYLRALAAKPDCDNIELWEAVAKLPMFAGNKFDPERASTARKSLGINIVRKAGSRTTTVNTTLFHATLKMAKIEGYPTPSASYSEPDPGFKNLPTAAKEAAKTQVPAPAPAPAPMPDKVFRDMTPAPVAAPAASAPAVVVEPKNEKWPNDDFKTLLSLMREHMGLHNIKALTITETGVSFKRIEVVEGDLAI